MDQRETSGGASFGRRSPTAVLWLWGWMVDSMAVLGTALIVVLMAIICSDVVIRNLFGFSLPVVAEVSALTLVMIVYLQLAVAVRYNRLARADIIILALEQARPQLAAILSAAFNLVGAAMLALIAWSTLGILEADVARGRYIGVTGVLTVPTWPFRLVILFGMAVAAIQFAGQVVAALCHRPQA